MKLLADIAKEALELPPVQRLTLARILLDLSQDDSGFSPEAEAEWEKEIANRIDAVKASTVRTKAFDQVFKDLDQRYPS
jgi:hypothetical protein